MRILIAAVFILVAMQAKSQDSVDRKYLVALLYLKSDTGIINKIRTTFFKADTGRSPIEFVINEKLWFHPLYSFSYYLKQNDWGIDKALIDDRNLFSLKYNFEPVKFPLIAKLLPPTSSKIVLTFSKPFQNFLIAEMLDGRRNSTNEFKKGQVIEFLFIFDQDGLIQRVLTLSPYYR